MYISTQHCLILLFLTLWNNPIVPTNCTDADERVTYFEIGPEYEIEGSYNICPQVEFDISTCQDIQRFSAICRGEGGYQIGVTGKPHFNDPDITICCSFNGNRDGSIYVNASEFARYLDGQEVGVLTTIGCDFSSEGVTFLSLKKFKRIQIKAPDGTIEAGIDADDDNTRKWVGDVAEGSTAVGEYPSVLHIDKNLFSHKRESGDVVKSFSFLEKNGTMTTVTYFGT